MWRLRLSRRGLPRLGFLQTVVPFLVLLTACPRRFDPRAQEVHGSSPVAEADFRSAEKLLTQGALAEGEKVTAEVRLEGYTTKEIILDGKKLRFETVEERARVELGVELPAFATAEPAITDSRVAKAPRP